MLGLAPYPERAPSTRYRLGQMVAPLAERGIELEIRTFLDDGGWQALAAGGGARRGVRTLADGWGALRSTLEEVPRWDVVLIQRGLAPAIDRVLVDRVRRLPRPVVYDFDDAIFLPQHGGRWWIERLRGPRGTTAAFCRAAAVVLAGNAFLADFARRAVGPGREDRVEVLPSVVDTARFRPPPPGARERPRPVLGWVGSASTLAYLDALVPALRDLAARVPHELRVVAAGARPELGGLDFTWETWQPEREVAYFQELDVGLHPLDDTPWSRGKCGFKAIQYLACGAPCVASPVGVLRDVVQPGVTGLHADDPAAWSEACARLLTTPAERSRMGAAGRKLVEASYSVAAAVPRLAAALERAASG